MERRITKKVFVGDVPIGGGEPISIQSMTKTKTEDIKSTINQIKELEDYGCQIVRVAVPNINAALATKEIRKKIKIPLVADIHFDYRLALTALDEGVDKIRINPGNIGSIKRIHKILEKAKERSVPIRIGVNSGSLEKDIFEKYQKVTPEALVESALRNIKICEDADFDKIVISIKSSDVCLMINAYRLISNKMDYPLHIGVTEAGTLWSGTIKSSIGIGALLADGIGDTIRVSITGSPVEEVKVAKEILKSLNIRNDNVILISCPTCGRLQADLIPIVEQLEKEMYRINKPLKIAIMGCAVNGPGEAREADIGVAFGKKSALIFKKGSVIAKIPENKVIETLLLEVKNWEF
jgi:(E)-4-hydroxy-3-methylbut-2-enyl-diphosphate synthase